MATRFALQRTTNIKRQRALSQRRVAQAEQTATYQKQVSAQTRAQQAIMQTASQQAMAAQQETQQFVAQQRQEAFERISPFLQDLSGGGAEGVPGDTSASDVLTATIEQRGAEAQSRLSTEMARRGIFRSGPSAAASARLTGETEAAVGTAKAQFAESAAKRKQQERQSRRQALTNLLSTQGGFT